MLRTATEASAITVRAHLSGLSMRLIEACQQQPGKACMLCRSACPAALAAECTRAVGFYGTWYLACIDRRCG